MAKEAAEKFLSLAKEKGLDAAATERKLPVIETGKFSDGPGEKLEKFKLADEVTPTFIDGAMKLLETRLKTKDEHPMGLIELPRGLAVVVGRLEDASPAAEDSLFSLKLMWYPAQGRAALAGDMAMKWFNPRAIQARMHFTLRDQKGGEEQAPPPSEDLPPIL